MRTRAMVRPAALAALVVAIGLGIVYRDAVNIDALRAWVQADSPAAALWFVAGYVLATVLFLPGSVFGLAGGVLFGPLWGTLWNLLGALLGASAAFFIARHVARDWVDRRVAGRGAELMRGIDAEGWRFVAFVRLVPLFPFNLLNYALGLTRIGFPQYFAASALAMFPGVLLYTWVGYAGREALAGTGSPEIVLAALALLAVVAFLPRLARRLRAGAPTWVEPKLLERMLRHQQPVTVVDVRNPEEFARASVPGARNIPLAQLASQIHELAASRRGAIVLVCRTHKRSQLAARLLAKAGLTDVAVLRGGVHAWSQEAFGVPQEMPGE